MVYVISRLILLFLVLPGCIAVQVAQEYRDPQFTWDALKRDQILMMPFLDLREDSASNPLPFFSQEEQITYLEAFKQVFFKTRKDIRVYGAGGAFEHLIQVAELDKKSAKILRKEPLDDAERASLAEGTQGIRFFMAFAMTEESLRHEFNLVQPSKQQPYILKTYRSIHAMRIKMALWDSKENKTVWIGSKLVQPEATRSFRTRPAVVPKGADISRVVFDADDSPFETPSLASELRLRPERFPDYPGREPALSGSFDDFSLSFPIQPSEEKYIEYESFTYHRPEIGLQGSKLGSKASGHLQIGFSSILHNLYRMGAAFQIPLTTTKAALAEKKYNLSYSVFAATLDLEFEIAENRRLLVGSQIGSAVFSADPETNETDALASDKSDGEKEGTPENQGHITDATAIYWPHVRMIFGARKGVQLGLGISYRAFDGLEEAIFKQNLPSPWSADLSVAYTFRGF